SEALLAREIFGGKSYTGRYFAMSLRKPLRPRRGGGRVVRGRDACVALAGGGKRAQEQGEGDASVPTPRPHLSRPYECDDLPPKSLPLKGHRRRGLSQHQASEAGDCTLRPVAG